MRRNIVISLGLTVLLTGWALVKNPSNKVIAPTQRRTDADTSPIVLSSVVTNTSARDGDSLAQHWSFPAVDSAFGNPFISQQLLPIVSKDIPKIAVKTNEPPPPTPAPPFGYRFIGRFLSPEGHPFIYIAQNEIVVAVEVGTELTDGYVVEAITENTIEFIYPPLKQHVSMPIPIASSSTSK